MDLIGLKPRAIYQLFQNTSTCSSTGKEQHFTCRITDVRGKKERSKGRKDGRKEGKEEGRKEGKEEGNPQKGATIG